MASGKRVTKKVINSPETCVDDSLRGVVALYPSLQLHAKYRVVTVRNKGDTKRVAIVGGGGSGHEPFTAGYLGDGMLDGAVAGGIFASPPTGHVLYAITHLYKYNSGGVFLIIPNYTGDRLNFGKAIEKARIAGIKVDCIIVGEDVASSHNKTGGRGIGGQIAFHKICGAMSQRGFDLETIKNTAYELHKYIATLGVCLTACSLPGQPPLFEIHPDEMEVGVGVHGEAGTEKRKMGTAKEIVALILEKVISHLKLGAGDRVVVLLNNLGATSFLEMNIVAAEAKDYLENKKITVERIISGFLKASLDMQGFQISLLNLNKKDGDFWLDLLDSPTSSLGWPGGSISVRTNDVRGDESTMQSEQKKIPSGPTLSKSGQEIFKGALLRAAEEIIVNEQLLNKLDSGCGDGDCGITLTKCAKAVTTYIQSTSLEYPSQVLWDLSEIAETDMGGTSGGIYSLGLSAASQTLSRGKQNDVKLWLSALESAMASISKYGGAEPGDRTMLDTLHAAYVAMKNNLEKEFKEVLKSTADAADKGAKSTVNMTANAGRASYVASDYLTDEDAGARAAAIWLNAILRYIINKY